MSKRTSKVFVGSSSEALKTAEIFADMLRKAASVVLWRDAPQFRATYSNMDSLLQATQEYDYGFFIFTPDDRIVSRGKDGSMGRDNVLFEFGLFLGALGKDRVFAVAQEGTTEEEKLKIPTDLWGIVIPRFQKLTSIEDLQSAADSATLGIRRQIDRYGPRPLNMSPVIGWGFDLARGEFSMTLGEDKLTNMKEKIKDMQFCVVVRKTDKTINASKDLHIAKSETRELDYPLHDMAFRVKTNGKIQSVEPGDEVTGYLWLVPSTCNVDTASTMDAMREMGCELLDEVGRTIPKKESGS
ncbi:MAG: nucleotide-binding protein [Chloroflexi bacterium]|nr:nucleotide-binding protein [Chloroflexota bacterium]